MAAADELELGSSPQSIPVPSKFLEVNNHPLQSPSLSSVAQRSAYRARILPGSANTKLCHSIVKNLNLIAARENSEPFCLEDCDVGRFNDGEIQLQVKNNVRGADVFIVQPTSPPDVNGALMELLLLIHTLRLSSAKRITAVIPYFGYARQDRKTKPRVPISASAVAQLMEAMEPHRIVTVDLHCGQIQGFFQKTPVDNLYAENQIIEYFRYKGFLGKPSELVIVSPDAGGVARATRVANKTRAHSVVTILKRRVEAGKVSSMQLVGEVEGKIAVIVDDMIDTAGTLCLAAQLLKENGAAKVYAFATHGLLSGPACDRINDSCLEEVCVTDSIDQSEKKTRCRKLSVISLGSLLAEAIYRLHNEESLSALFTDAPFSADTSVPTPTSASPLSPSSSTSRTAAIRSAMNSSDFAAASRSVKVFGAGDDHAEPTTFDLEQ